MVLIDGSLLVGSVVWLNDLLIEIIIICWAEVLMISNVVQTGFLFVELSVAILVDLCEQSFQFRLCAHSVSLLSVWVVDVKMVKGDVSQSFPVLLWNSEVNGTEPCVKLTHSCHESFTDHRVVELCVGDGIRDWVLPENLVDLVGLVDRHLRDHLSMLQYLVSVQVDGVEDILVKLVLYVQPTQSLVLYTLSVPVVFIPHWPLEDHVTSSIVLLLEVSDHRVDLSKSGDWILVLEISLELISRKHFILINIDRVEELVEVIVMNVAPLDGGPVLPPAQLIIIILVVVIESEV